MTAAGMFVLPEVTAGIIRRIRYVQAVDPVDLAAGVDDRVDVAGRVRISAAHIAPVGVVVVHGGAVDVALDRLSPRDVRARESLPVQQPAQFRRLRYLGVCALQPPSASRARSNWPGSLR